MPIFKSFADTLLLVYLCVEFGLQVPFMFGSNEEFPDLPKLKNLCQQCGYIDTHNQSYIFSKLMLSEVVLKNKLSIVF